MGEPVEIVPYDPEWPLRFGREKQRLEAALGERALGIEHVGSTAVPGLAAKPIVDIQLSVGSFEPLHDYQEPLAGLGYGYRPDDDSEHRFFLLEEDGRRAVQIHVCEAGGVWERYHLAFRDYLIAHPRVAEAYEDQKRRLAALHRNDRVAYADAKTPFIRSIDEHARRWIESGRPR